VSQLIQFIERVRGGLTGAEWRFFNAHYIERKPIEEAMPYVPGADGDGDAMRQSILRKMRDGSDGMSDADVKYEEKRNAGAQFFRDLALEMIELTASDLAKPLPDRLDRTTTASRRRAEYESALSWVNERTNNPVVPFSLCCDAYNVSTTHLREALLTRPGTVLAEIRATLKDRSAHDRATTDHESGERRASFRL